MQAEPTKTILLVEDQAIIAMSETKTLKNNGFNVIVAANGKDAVKIANENTLLELILMDIDLGKGIDGTEAAQIILQDREIPIVFLSNHTEKEVVERTEKITSYGYVLKDAGETVLIASIKMAFKLFEANKKIKNELAERKRAEEAQRASDEKYKKIVEGTRALLFSVDKKGRFIYINETAASTFGYSREELIGRFYLKFVHPEDRKLIHEVFAKQLSGVMQDVSVEFRYIKKNNTFGWLSFLTNQIYQDNQVIGLTGVAQDITARKQIENELRENEERYRSIVENLNQAYYEADRKGVFTYCNPGLILISGYSEKELLGTISFNLVAEENRKEIVYSYKRSLIQKETNITTEFKVQTKNGQKFWVEQVTNFEFDTNGDFLNATNIIRNIDERKQAEEALKFSEEKYRKIFENVQDVFFLTDKNGRLTDISPSIERHTEYPLEELIGQPVYQHYFNKDDRLRFLKEIKQAGEVNEFETQLITKTGKVVYVSMNAHYRHDKQGSIIGIEGSLKNINERKNVEEALRVSLTKFQVLFESFPFGITITDKDGNIKESNKEAERLLGLSNEEQMKRHIAGGEWHIIGTDGNPMPAEKYAGVIALKEDRLVKNIEMGIVKGKDEVTWISVTAAPIPLDDYGVAIVYGDIKERKQAEQILKNAAAEKEALHSELLHRVKNSFSQIKSILYFEREKLIDPHANKILGNLEMRVGTLAEMYSMLNASGVSELINLGKYLEQIIKSVKESYLEDDTKISIKTSLDIINTTPKIASSVGLIINELLTNSLKYAFPNDRKGIISVILKSRNETVEVEVSDNGVGLPNEFNIEQSTGMGLQLVNMFVNQLSGKLTVDNKNGANFKFIFPVNN